MRLSARPMGRTVNTGDNSTTRSPPCQESWDPEPCPGEDVGALDAQGWGLLGCRSVHRTSGPACLSGPPPASMGTGEAWPGEQPPGRHQGLTALKGNSSDSLANHKPIFIDALMLPPNFLIRTLRFTARLWSLGIERNDSWSGGPTSGAAGRDLHPFRTHGEFPTGQPRASAGETTLSGLV